MTPFSEWPHWLQFIVVFPNVLLGFVATWLWWPKTGKSWRKFGFVALYLLCFYLVMHFVFRHGRSAECDENGDADCARSQRGRFEAVSHRLIIA